jgi:sterol desaturase/sphingolipid hydroxylase (fatty acid hydroxylase superfamily)
MSLPPALAVHVHQVVELALLTVGFFILALIVKGARAISDGRAAAAETKTNLVLFLMDKFTVAPVLVLAAGTLYTALHAPGAVYWGESFWAQVGPFGTGFAAIVICDFIGYCNHRVFHTSVLWPSHAIHHSDTRLTWVTLLRMHPIDRLGPLVDMLGMILLGLPDWAIVVAVSVRHYYGHIIHADLPWTLGPLNWIFISPAMHRWHHALEQRGETGVNFATVFSVFDRAFGTFYAPGPCNEPTGISETIAPGLIGQYLHPFKVWFPQLKTTPLEPAV